MDKEGFQLTLEEVQDDHGEGEGLQGGGPGIEGREGVDVGTQVVDQRVDEERAEVFDDEDGAPGDLGTCVLLVRLFECVPGGAGSVPRSLTWIVSPSCSSVLATVTLLSLGIDEPLGRVIRRRWMENLDSAAMRSYRSAVLPWM